MSDSKIEWTDKTWNPVTGCAKVSPGCAHCYAETMAKRMWATQYPKVTPSGAHPNSIPVATLEGFERDDLMRSRRFDDVWTHEERLLEPLSWRKPARVFVNSMSDLFHEDVPDAFIDRVFAVMALAPQHTFQILTKRADRMNAYLTQQGLSKRIAERMVSDHRDVLIRRREIMPGNGFTIGGVRTWPLPNVWLGVSVENQHFADERIPLLLQTPAAVRFISAEPLLGPVDLRALPSVSGIGRYLDALSDAGAKHSDVPHKLDWVIVGGESGAGARPFDLAWARSIVTQCKAAGVACFVKQLGAEPFDGAVTHLPPLELIRGLKDRKGGDPSEWPEDLRVRQFPEARQ